MKKGKEWFIKELLGHEIGDYGNYYNGGYEDGLAYALKLAHQLDEPEKIVIPQFVADWIEEMKQDKRPLCSVMSTLMNKTNHEWAIWKSANMNFSEIVAQAWLDGYQFEKEKLYKVVIPQSVADWWERDDDSVTMYGRLRVEKKHKFDLISIFYDKGLGDYLSKVEDWIYENDSAFLDLVNGKPYEVEKEKLYYVELIKGRRYVVQASDGAIWFSYTVQKEGVHGDKVMFTQREIAAIDPRFWQFAVEVAE